MARWVLLVVLAVLVLSGDQLGKSWAVLHLTSAGKDGSSALSERHLESHRTDPRVLVPGFLQLRYIENPGAAWGVLGRVNARMRVPFFYAVSLLAIGFLLAFYRRVGKRTVPRAALGLVLGGALGNFADRLLRGYVIDFIDLHWGEIHWPTFNVADVAITLGVALLVTESLLAPRTPRRAPADPDVDPPHPAALAEEGWEPFP